VEDSVEIAEHEVSAGGRQTDACPVCGRAVQGHLFEIASLPEGLQSIIKPNATSADAAEVCGRCIELFDRAQRQIESHATIFEQNDFVLPTPLRMDADERFTGRGVTIAFLDSGFYAHSDLTTPNNRILAYHSIFAEEGDQTSLETNDVASWHGMMTSVVATGNGGLDGFYRGIAWEANVALVKIGRSGRITEDQIQKGLEWALTHME
jgi:serine protease AprX